MIDIFQEQKPPMLYIADVSIEVHIPKVTKKSRSFEVKKINLEKEPIVLRDGFFPNKKVENNFYKRLYNKHINKGKFEEMIFKVISIRNVKFSSKLAWNVD
jgi:hypothetical protein